MNKTKDICRENYKDFIKSKVRRKISMQRGNVLVIGNSGVGKSTLINSVFGEERAKTGWGSEGTTEHLEIYESNKIHFRIID